MLALHYVVRIAEGREIRLHIHLSKGIVSSPVVHDKGRYSQDRTIAKFPGS
jgi:hypothetical protein